MKAKRVQPERYKVDLSEWGIDEWVEEVFGNIDQKIDALCKKIVEHALEDWHCAAYFAMEYHESSDPLEVRFQIPLDESGFDGPMYSWSIGEAIKEYIENNADHSTQVLRAISEGLKELCAQIDNLPVAKET